MKYKPDGDEVAYTEQFQKRVLDVLDPRLVFEELGEAQTLRASESEVHLAGYAPLEELEVFGASDAGDEKVQAVDSKGVERRERRGEKVGLLLVVPFEDDAIAWLQHQTERFMDVLRL